MRNFFFKTHKKFTTNLIIFFILPQLSVNLRSFVVPLLSNVNFTRLAFFSFFTSSTSSELLNSEYSWGIIKNTLKKVQKKSLRACILNSSFVHKKSQHHYKKDCNLNQLHQSILSETKQKKEFLFFFRLWKKYNFIFWKIQSVLWKLQLL